MMFYNVSFKKTQKKYHVLNRTINFMLKKILCFYNIIEIIKAFGLRIYGTILKSAISDFLSTSFKRVISFMINDLILD